MPVRSHEGSVRLGDAKYFRATFEQLVTHDRTCRTFRLPPRNVPGSDLHLGVFLDHQLSTSAAHCCLCFKNAMCSSRNAVALVSASFSRPSASVRAAGIVVHG